MVSAASVEKQLSKLDFKVHGWGRAEVKELQHILVPDEEIYEVSNGMYEGGFALLVATDIRVLLIDKKPLNYLTVEDLRFDMINEIDYSHRLMGAQINITTGSKNLTFRSYNQARLRKLINHVQHCMAEAKKQQSTHQQGQNEHLQQINQQLQSYLAAQQEYQQQLQRTQLARQLGNEAPPVPQPVRPPNELSDYLFAKSLMAQHQAQLNNQDTATATDTPQQPKSAVPQRVSPISPTDPNKTQLEEMYAEGLREVFGSSSPEPAIDDTAAAMTITQPAPASMTKSRQLRASLPKPLEVNPLKIAYSKLPMVLRNRKLGRPSIARSVISAPARPEAEAGLN